MIMKKLLYTMLACCCLFLMGCPLQTESPIKSDSAVSIPSWLPGHWTQIMDGAPGTTSYQLKADPAAPGRLQVLSIENGAPANEHVRTAELAMVRGKLFLSVYDKGDETTDAGYYHYALSKAGNGDLELAPLKEFIVTSDASGEDLAAYIRLHTSADDYLEQKDILRYRKQK
jgi:hypothetical protein